MYRHILIPTDGSKLAHKGVAHGLSLAKALGARITVLTVEPLFLTKKFAEFKKEWSAQATSVLKEIADEAKAAGVQCETIQTAQAGFTARNFATEILKPFASESILGPV